MYLRVADVLLKVIENIRVSSIKILLVYIVMNLFIFFNEFKTIKIDRVYIFLFVANSYCKTINSDYYRSFTRLRIYSRYNRLSAHSAHVFKCKGTFRFYMSI